jgi:hypothetical protein
MASLSMSPEDGFYRSHQVDNNCGTFDASLPVSYSHSDETHPLMSTKSLHPLDCVQHAHNVYQYDAFDPIFDPSSTQYQAPETTDSPEVLGQTDSSKSSSVKRLSERAHMVMETFSLGNAH